MRSEKYEEERGKLMKQLIIINGPPGVGKTTVSKELYQSLNQAVWLDGDWCWMMHPWEFSAENIRMVETNITFLLRSYLSNSGFQYIVFNWVLHREEIIHSILAGLQDYEFDKALITLTCSEEALRERMLQDNRPPEQITASCGRLKLYADMDTYKIDTTGSTALETVTKIKERLKL
ncbi:AAA family ATPase [Paenibacillus tepidiphilus]|uniref:AAA family ATPase n=1 Tax=Paenibacillus tepidiphilus TaxID=2608683 RepID=UPI001EEFD093|nr:AAA family ATPase [Paenibacillus tepidiphilus]